MDQPTLAYDEQATETRVGHALSIEQQRIIISSLLRRLELRRKVLVRQRISFVVACLFALAGIATGIVGVQTNTPIVFFLVGMTAYGAAGLFLIITTTLHRGEDNLPMILDLIEENRAALSLLDTMTEQRLDRDQHSS